MHGAMVKAYTFDKQRGNPSYVLLTSTKEHHEAASYINLASRLACEVTVIEQEGAKHNVRFFAPSGEMVFCGHGTLAAAAWLETFHGTPLHQHTFCTKHAEIDVLRDSFGYYAYMQEAYAIVQDNDHEVLEQIEHALGIKVERVYFSVGAAREKVVVQVRDVSELSKIVLSVNVCDSFCESTKTTGFYVYSVGGAEAQAQRVITARHFPYGWKGEEDMATAAIAPTITQHLSVNDGCNEFVIMQGGPRSDYCKLFVEYIDERKAWSVKGECVVGQIEVIKML